MLFVDTRAKLSRFALKSAYFCLTPDVGNTFTIPKIIIASNFKLYYVELKVINVCNNVRAVFLVFGGYVYVSRVLLGCDRTQRCVRVCFIWRQNY